MKNLHVLFLVLGLISTAALGDAFVKFSGIDGESTDANHIHWSNLQTMSHGFSLANLVIDKKPATLPTVQLTKWLDKAGIRLQEKLLDSEVIADVQIEFTRSIGGSSVTYLKYTLYGVKIVNYGLMGSGEPEVPVEDLTLEFKSYDVVYTEYDDAGRSGGVTTTSYDFDIK